MGLRQINFTKHMRLKVSLFLVASLCLVTSCSSSEDALRAPGTVQPSTSGEICVAVRDGLKSSPLASAIAVGSCEEQKTANGGRSLWIEMNDFSAINSQMTDSDLKYVMVSAAVSLASFGFRATGERPSEFEQLFFSFRDARGSYFEISPAVMEKFVPGDGDITQEDWDSQVELGVQALVPSIQISYTR